MDKKNNFICKLLRKSQKFTGTDNVYIAKYGASITIGNVICILASFALSVVFAQKLPKEVYGDYRYILSIFGILSIASLPGINESIIRSVARGFEGIVRKGLKIKLKWSLIGSTASMFFSAYFFVNENVPLALSFIIVAIFLPFFKGGEIYQSYLSGKKLFNKKALYATLIQLTSTLVLVLTTLLTKKLVFLILAYFLSYSALRILFFFLTINRLKPNQLDDPGAITYGKHLSLISLIGLVSQQIDNVLVFSLFGPVQLAIYSFATMPINYIREPLQGIQEIALPKLSNAKEQDIKKTLPPKLIKSTLFILMMIVFYIFFAPHFYELIYPQYLESIKYSQLFSLTLLVFPISMMVLSLKAKMKTKEMYKISIISPLIQISLVAVFTPLFGLMGVIIAKLLSQVCYFFLALYFFKRIA